MAEQNGKSDAQLDSEHFSPYRADGKLVSDGWIPGKRRGSDDGDSMASSAL